MFEIPRKGFGHIDEAYEFEAKARHWLNTVVEPQLPSQLMSNLTRSEPRRLSNVTRPRDVMGQIVGTHWKSLTPDHPMGLHMASRKCFYEIEGVGSVWAWVFSYTLIDSLEQGYTPDEMIHDHLEPLTRKYAKSDNIPYSPIRVRRFRQWWVEGQ